MFTEIQLMQIRNKVMRILHVPGNYSGGILEMAIVADYHMSHDRLKEECSQIAASLKRTDEVFSNVRLNLIKWAADDVIMKEISALPQLQMGRVFEDYDSYCEKGSISESKTLDELFRQLKLFYARSKVIIVLTDGSYRVENEEKVREYLNPFLYRKLLILQQGGGISGNDILREILKFS